MSTLRRIVTSLILLAGLLGLAAPARAQSSPTLESLDIALWPEFDRPSVLVLMNGTLPADTTLPATLTLRLPVEPFAVAERTADGALLNAQHVTATVGSEVAVTLTLQQPAFRVEYYDTALRVNGDARQYEFQWATSVAARSVSVQVQAPPDASNLQLAPGFGAAVPGEYGLDYYATNLGAREAGDMISVTVGYTRPGTALTVDQVDTGGQVSGDLQPAPINIIGGTPTVDYTPWIVGGVVVVAALAVGGGAWYWRSQQSTRPRPKHHRARKAAPRDAVARSANGATAPHRFCTQCGQPLAQADRFCRQCGSPVKV